MGYQPRTGRVTPGAGPATRDLAAALAVCSFLLLAVAVVFGPTVGYDFVNFDDDIYVYENPQLMRGLGVEGIVWAFTTTDCSNWHPLTWLSYLLDYQLYGLKPWGYHLTNVLLHAATTVALFLVLWRMTGDLWPSAFVAAVFAIHPLRAESVAWVSERKDVLSGLFFMLTLGAYVSYVRRPFSLPRYLTVFVLFALGLMAKPMLVTLPFVLLLLDYWPLGRISLSVVPWRLLVEKLPLLALSAASCIITPLCQGDAVQTIDRFSLTSRTANALISYAAYLGHFFYPVGLAGYYTHPENRLPIGEVLGAVLLLAGVTAAALAARRRWPWLLVGWLWYLGMLVPVIGLVQVGYQSMADRYTYLPQIGLVMALAWGAKGLLGSWPHRAWACGIAAALVLPVLMGCAWRNTSYWYNGETFWTRNMACAPSNVLAYNNLGAFLHRHGDLDAALALYQKALALAPDYAEAHNNLGMILAKRGPVEEAMAHYRRALQLKPNYPEAHNNLGLTLVERGLVDDAISHYRQALEIKPDYAEAHNNLGLALIERGPIDEAIAHCRRALELKPDYAEACNNLGLALAEDGQMEEALLCFRKALSLAIAQNDTGLAESLRVRIQRCHGGSPENQGPPASTSRSSSPERD